MASSCGFTYAIGDVTKRGLNLEAYWTGRLHPRLRVNEAQETLRREFGHSMYVPISLIEVGSRLIKLLIGPTKSVDVR